MHDVVEYGIHWLSPEEMAGSLTPCASRDQAEHWLKISLVMPGEQRGILVHRLITFGDWEFDN